MEGHHGFGIYIIVQYIEGSNTSIVTHKWVEAIIMHVRVDDEIMWLSSQIIRDDLHGVPHSTRIGKSQHGGQGPNFWALRNR